MLIYFLSYITHLLFWKLDTENNWVVGRGKGEKFELKKYLLGKTWLIKVGNQPGDHSETFILKEGWVKFKIYKKHRQKLKKNTIK